MANQVNTKYDAGARRRTLRKGRERGCWVYVPAEELLKTGINPEHPAPLCRVWGRERGSVMIRLYDATRFCTRCGRQLAEPKADALCSICEANADPSTETGNP